jgi:hypothetical protein
MKPKMGSARWQQDGGSAGSFATREKAMTQEPTTDTKTREISRTPPKCLLRWTVDPETGKPVARWTVEQPEKTASSLLRPAA